MKILLIQPNSHNWFPRTCAIPLGLLYIASALRQAGYNDVSVLDARVRRLGPREISAHIKSLSPDIVGITAMSTEAGDVSALARLAREAAPRCKVLVGGPYTVATPEEVVKDPNVDFAVIGEAETTVCELVSALQKGGDTSVIPGLAYMQNGSPCVNPRREMIEDVDGIPFPAWDLVDLEKYFHLWVRHTQNPFPASERTVPLFTSRGCPYGCIYCHNIFGKKARLRSVDNVLREIELLAGKYGVREIEIVDDVFNIDLVRAKRICDELIRRGIKIHISFPNGLRVDRMDEELVLKLKKAGMHMAVYAIESASPEVQKRIGKNLDLEKARRMIRFTAEQGIFVGGFFMLGFPGETKEEMLATARFAKEMPFHQAYFFYVTPRPNTPLYEMVGKKFSVPPVATHTDYFTLSVNLSAASSEELRAVMEKAKSDFYDRPLQFLRIVRSIPNMRYVLKLLLRAIILRSRA